MEKVTKKHAKNHAGKKVTERHIGKTVLLRHSGGVEHVQHIRSVGRYMFGIVDRNRPDLPFQMDRSFNRVIKVLS